MGLPSMEFNTGGPHSCIAGLTPVEKVTIMSVERTL